MHTFVKVKKYYVLIFDPKMFIPFVNGVKLTKNLLSIKISIYFAHICGVIVEKLKGGLRRVKFWPFLSWNICKRKDQIASFSVQPLINIMIKRRGGQKQRRKGGRGLEPSLRP